MKKTINQKQLENMIAECVSQVLAESRQPRQQKPTRKVMNEAQLQNYIQGIINEELENEGLWGKVKGAAQGLGKAVSGEFNKMKRGIMDNGLNNEYQYQGFKDRLNAAKQTVKDNAAIGDNRQELASLQKQVNAVINHPLVQKHPQWVQTLQGMVKSLGKSSNAQGTQPAANYKQNYGVGNSK